MNQMSIWAALFSLTETTDIAEAIARMEADPTLAKKFADLTVGQDWAAVRPQMQTREDADRLLESMASSTICCPARMLMQVLTAI